MVPSKPSKSSKKISPSFRGVIKDKQKKGKKKKEVAAASVQPAAEDGEDLYQEPVRRVIRPENQLKLTEEQLKEDVSRVLTGDDPNAPRSVSKYNFKDRCYKPDPPGQSDHMAVHLYLRGNALHVDDDDYKAQKEAEERRAEAAAAAQREETNDGDVDGDDKNKSDDRQQRPPSESDVVGGGGKNAFNYSDRSSQTLHDPSRHRGVSTEPPAVAQYGADVSQWRIYDSYLSDHLVSGMEEKNERNNGKSVSFEDRIAVILDEDRGDGSRDADDAKRMADALRIMERLVNQNAEDEIFQDFKYWEDASDSYREGEGSLLPLWRFTAERSRRRQVTDLCWNPRYSDLFAVGYGSYDFVRQGSGVICCFSLKNTSFPEYTFATESGVMCLDFHPQHPSLLAVGCYDGTVLVFNVGGGGATNSNKPIYASTTRTGKHADPVWQVHWQKDDYAGGTNGGGGTRELNFYSISSDGRVANWSLSKNDLKMEPVMQLKLVKNSSNSNGGGGGGKDDHSHHPPEADITNTATSLTGLAGGCCFDFNRTREHLFIVGTEEGNIHKCSKAYSGQYLETYSEGHHMAVYAVRWNPFHPSVFVSCSADWTVRLWDDRDSTLRPSGSAGAGVVGGRPFATFDLGNAVGDVCWSPRSSTVFAAVTDDGKVRVFDLSVSKHGPLCEQRVVARARLTRARFNARDHVIVVGDDRGGVSSLKLSPNLRRSGREDDDATTDAAAAPIDDAAFQRERMDRLLATFDSGPSSS